MAKGEGKSSPAKKKKTVTSSKGNATTSKKPKSGRTTASKESGKSRNPLYVLVIMGLCTAIFLLIARYQQKERNTGQNNKSGTESTNAMFPGDRNSHAKEEKSKSQEEITEKETAPLTAEVKVYFIRLDEKTERLYLTSAKRQVSRKSLVANTLKELIKGPNASEKRKGVLSAVPSNLKLRSATVRNGTIVLDFNSAIEREASGNILLSRIDQIVYTATQFKGIDNVIIKIDGVTRTSLGSDGLSIGGPLHRRQ